VLDVLLHPHSSIPYVQMDRSIVLYTVTRAVPKLMPPILLCWLTTSEVNIVDMAVEVEPSRQHSVKFCCRATDDSRGAV